MEILKINQLRKIVVVVAFSVVGTFLVGTAQNYDPFIQEQVDELDYDSLYSRMSTLENLGIKVGGSEALDNTRDWIVDMYQQWGYTDIEFDEFNYGSNPVQNIIITKTGTVYPETYLIVDGHYDTWGGPGVNDNGSGTAIVLEIARMMKDMESTYSIMFIHFTMEEPGLIGSTHYVDNTVVPQDLDIRLVFNIDEVGGVAGEVNNTITCERDESSPNENNAASAAFTDTLVSLTELYSALNTSISHAYGSDYVPFMKKGYVVTGYYETNESNYPHTINDSLANLDPEYVFELSKAALASTMYFSGAYASDSYVADQTLLQYRITIEPNPFANQLRVENDNTIDVLIQLLDLHGKCMKEEVVPSASIITFETTLPPGMYFYRILSEDKLLQTGKLIGK